MTSECPKPEAGNAAVPTTSVPAPSAVQDGPAPVALSIASLGKALDRFVGEPVTKRLIPCAITSILACAFVVIEHRYGNRNRQSYLAFNLFLGWLPVLWSCLALHLSRRGGQRPMSFWVCSALWLLFLPNAPYVFTDLTHLLGKSLPHYWPDMAKILLFAMGALGAGMLSLRLMHGLVAREYGRTIGWLFVLGVSVLSSIGVALGRFRRWNSWDALHNPQNILKDAFDLTGVPSVTHPTGWFVVMLSVLIFCSYLLLMGLEPHTQTGEPEPKRLDAPK